MENVKTPKDYANEFQAQVEEASNLQKELNVSLGVALTIVGDRASRKRADDYVARGDSPLSASIQVGSFARFDWLAEQYYSGTLSAQEFFPVIAHYWSSADPDDTNPKFRTIWREAAKFNKDRVIIDETRLPYKKMYTVYRGQPDKNDPLGLSWTLSKSVATKFAYGAALRTRLPSGWIAETRVARSGIIAYITGRGEEELIIDPAHVMDVFWTEV